MHFMRCLAVLITSVTVLLPNSVPATVIQCPSTTMMAPMVQRFIQDIRPVPFSQCYYTAIAVKTQQKNHCRVIHKKLKTQLFKDYQIKIKNWECHYFRSHPEHNYIFTFLAVYPTRGPSY